MKRLSFVLSALILCVRLSHAGEDYRCIIDKRIASGETSAAQSHWKGIYLGKQFTVERNTGLMAGALKNSFMTKPQVIDRGSKDNSFKVVTTMRKNEGLGAGSNIYALTIREYDTSPKKPFVFLENDVVYIGVCEHF